MEERGSPGNYQPAMMERDDPRKHGKARMEERDSFGKHPIARISWK